jgi:hypothetical protein
MTSAHLFLLLVADRGRVSGVAFVIGDIPLSKIALAASAVGAN